MVSKNILAILIIVAVAISIVGSYIVLDSATVEDQEVAAGTAKVRVIEPTQPPSSAGYAIVNVIEKSKGG
jgi:hypothetical protein